MENVGLFRKLNKVKIKNYFYFLFIDHMIERFAYFYGWLMRDVSKLEISCFGCGRKIDPSYDKV